VLHGALNRGVLTQAGLGVLGGAGVACAVFGVVSLGAGLVVSLQHPWTRVAIRVAGSWIAATGLLMLGWGLRG
jgi:urease accessory protein